MINVSMRDDHSADDWINEAELRARLHYSKSTITRLRARGLPVVGTGRLRRYHWPAVLQWLSQRA